ncbi:MULTISPECIES: hypothetical protein [unclassified Frondihabitans]|uniref:hypothetical protein n=1 Tax=unclassified Frondihabitans TaxID=2626248 RepID=UPI000F4D3F05|nr:MULTISPECIES: hypothetical protein [unclassified Frondihabitans]RPE77894.1 hypothetical protein EDF37_0562 [Frondihabitans sp. PhB153]RPF08174.1 hypothetical protein EDF39_0563 [Frondihabitans sp. PhB161]
MSDSFKSTVIEVAKVAIGVWMVLVVSPILSGWFPDLPELAGYAITTIFAAVVLEIVWLFVFLRPELSLTWTRDADPDTQTRLDVVMDRASNESSSLFKVTIQGVRKSGLGRLIVHLALTHGLTVKVTAVNANLLFILDDYNTGLQNQPLARSATRECGIVLDIPSPFTTGAMNYAAVRVRSRGAERRGNYTIDYKKSGSRGIGAICARLVHIDAKVVTMKERWS